MNNFYSLYNNITKESKISLINEQNIINELKIRLITEGITPNEEDLIEVSKACVELYEDRHWAMALGWHLLGALDPTGAVDLGHAIWYWMNGQILSGILTFIGVLPVMGDAVKFLIPFTKAGKAIKMVPNGPALSFVKMAINKMPSIQRGLTNLVTKLIKNPKMKEILIKTFGMPSRLAGKYGTTGGQLDPLKVIWPDHIANQIINHIVNKMIGPFEKFLRMMSGPRMYQSVKGALTSSGVKTAAYNADFSEIPYLKKFSTAPDKNIQRNKDSAYIQQYIDTHYKRPTSQEVQPQPLQAAPKRRKIDLGAY